MKQRRECDVCGGVLTRSEETVSDPLLRYNLHGERWCRECLQRDFEGHFFKWRDESFKEDLFEGERDCYGRRVYASYRKEDE